MGSASAKQIQEDMEMKSNTIGLRIVAALMAFGLGVLLLPLLPFGLA